jgi:single-strand DNA-binding protein
MADTYVSIAGNLTGDPELRFTTQGTAVATCRVAVTSRTFEGGEWRDGGTSFYDVTAWRGLAEHVAASVGKGARVMVIGRLRQRSWETPKGGRRSKVEIEAEEIGPSLRFVTATLTKAADRQLADATS